MGSLGSLGPCLSQLGNPGLAWLPPGCDAPRPAAAARAARYSSEWEKTVRRIGRWIDFEQGYKTLDPTFMESVWWVFSELHKKGLVYRGFKARAGCCALGTLHAEASAARRAQQAHVPHVARRRAASTAGRWDAGHAVLHGLLHAAVQLRGRAQLQGRVRPRRYGARPPPAALWRARSPASMPIVSVAQQSARRPSVGVPACAGGVPAGRRPGQCGDDCLDDDALARPAPPARSAVQAAGGLLSGHGRS